MQMIWDYWVFKNKQQTIVFVSENICNNTFAIRTGNICNKTFAIRTGNICNKTFAIRTSNIKIMWATEAKK